MSTNSNHNETLSPKLTNLSIVRKRDGKIKLTHKAEISQNQAPSPNRYLNTGFLKKMAHVNHDIK